MISSILLGAGSAHVDALDASPAMLDAARAIGMPDGVALHLGDATGPLPFPDAAFDLVWLGDFWDPGALGEIRRVLRTGGRLVTRETSAMDWMPQDDSEFAGRVETATDAGVAGWVTGFDSGSHPRPDGALPGWETVDAWSETVEFAFPVPEAVEEFLLQDFACFHGAFAAPHLSDSDWTRLCALIDPDSPDRALAGTDARFAWTFDYRVFR